MGICGWDRLCGKYWQWEELNGDILLSEQSTRPGTSIQVKFNEQPQFCLYHLRPIKLSEGSELDRVIACPERLGGVQLNDIRQSSSIILIHLPSPLLG